MAYKYDSLYISRYSCFSGYIKYSIKVYVKDNKCKVVLTNFRHFVKIGNSSTCQLGVITTSAVYTDFGLSKKFQNKVWVDIKEKVQIYSNATFSSLESFLNKIKESNNDDW